MPWKRICEEDGSLLTHTHTHRRVCFYSEAACIMHAALTKHPGGRTPARLAICPVTQAFLPDVAALARIPGSAASSCVHM